MLFVRGLDNVICVESNSRQDPIEKTDLSQHPPLTPRTPTIDLTNTYHYAHTNIYRFSPCPTIPKSTRLPGECRSIPAMAAVQSKWTTIPSSRWQTMQTRAIRRSICSLRSLSATNFHPTRRSMRRLQRKPLSVDIAPVD